MVSAYCEHCTSLITASAYTTVEQMYVCCTSSSAMILSTKANELYNIMYNDLVLKTSAHRRHRRRYGGGVGGGYRRSPTCWSIHQINGKYSVLPARLLSSCIVSYVRWSECKWTITRVCVFVFMILLSRFFMIMIYTIHILNGSIEIHTKQVTLN